MYKLYIKDDNLCKDFHYLIPVSLLEMKCILESAGYPEYATKSHLPKFYYLIHKLREEVIIDKSIEKDSYINLHSNILDDLFGSRYTPAILKILKEIKVIESDRHYVIGGKSIGYRLNRKYINEPFKWHIDESKFTKKLIRYKNDKINRYINKKEYHSILLNLTSLSFNYNKLYNYLLKSLNNLSLYNLSIFISCLLCTDNLLKEDIIKDLKKLQEELQAILYTTKEPELILPNLVCTYIFDSEEFTLEKLINDITCIIKIIKKDWFFVVDNKGNRLHNNLTNLNKELRHCLILDGSEDNVNIDISCSQPSLLGFQCKEYLKERGIDYRAHKDLVKYIVLSLKKDIYTYLMEKSGYLGTRAEFKEEFYQKILFGRIYKNELFDIFQKEFPTVWNIIYEIKKNDYRQLSTQLQQLESNVMFSGIIKRLLQLDPDICCLTIHDSIFTHRKNLYLVKQVMSDVFYERFGERIKLSTDKYRLDELSDSLKQFMIEEGQRAEDKIKKEQAKKEAEEFNQIHEHLDLFEIITEDY